jgi:transcription antitermination factor NusG
MNDTSIDIKTEEVVVPEAKWYVVHTQSGFEVKAKNALEQRIKTLGILDRIFEIIIPMRDVMTIKKGEKKSVKEKVFPGYLLIKMVLDDDSWLVVRTTQGITGFVGAGNKPTPISEKDLEECELLIEGIGRDKISDITTNIIRHKLIEYTQEQCDLWNIPMQSIPSGFIWDDGNKKWINRYENFPICNGRSVLLVPKSISRFDIEFNHQEYYQHFVLNFLQSEHLDANSSLVRTLKDGTKRPPTKKTLKELNPLSKKFLYEFSKEHADVLQRYKLSKNVFIREITNEEILSLASEKAEEQTRDFELLSEKLDSIPAGDADATVFHNHIIGVLTAIFYPYLTNPKKEQEIHDGRKRVDIVFQNSAHDGFFFELSKQ